MQLDTGLMNTWHMIFSSLGIVRLSPSPSWSLELAYLCMRCSLTSSSTCKKATCAFSRMPSYSFRYGKLILISAPLNPKPLTTNNEQSFAVFLGGANHYGPEYLVLRLALAIACTISSRFSLKYLWFSSSVICGKSGGIKSLSIDMAIPFLTSSAFSQLP